MDYTVSYTQLRTSLKAALDKVCDDHLPIRIQRRQGRNVVMVSEEDYNALEETAYLLRSPKNAARLAKALEDLAKGEVARYESIDELRCEIGLDKRRSKRAGLLAKNRHTESPQNL